LAGAAVVVRAAMERMRQLGRPSGLLFCRDELVPFYRWLGWLPLVGDVTVEQPAGNVIMPLRTCWIALAAGARLPSGPLALHGLPF
jgi:hypothetical protein